MPGAREPRPAAPSLRPGLQSLDDKRTPLLDDDKLSVDAKLTDDEHDKNNLPDALARWTDRNSTELDRARTDQSESAVRGLRSAGTMPQRPAPGARWSTIE